MKVGYEDEKCPECRKAPAEEDHICPFAEEIGGDSESMCNCCEDCEMGCAMDI